MLPIIVITVYTATSRTSDNFRHIHTYSHIIFHLWHIPKIGSPPVIMPFTDTNFPEQNHHPANLGILHYELETKVY